MKGKKTITILIIINILLIGVICNFIKKDYLNNERIIIKTMTETENESQIETLNQSHQNYKDYIQTNKTELATAITNKGVTTTADSSLETMTANVNKIVTNPPASLISYDNTSSGLSATNVQGAVDKLNANIETQDKILQVAISSLSPYTETEFPCPWYNYELLCITWGTYDNIIRAMTIPSAYFAATTLNARPHIYDLYEPNALIEIYKKNPSSVYVRASEVMINSNSNTYLKVYGIIKK